MASNSKKNVSRVSQEPTATEAVFHGIISIVEKQNASNWTGTMTTLTKALNRVLSKSQREILPGSPAALRVVINKVVNRLRNRGIGVRFGRTTDHNRTRFVRFAQ